jgi:hypothetical protein
MDPIHCFDPAKLAGLSPIFTSVYGGVMMNRTHALKAQLDWLDACCISWCDGGHLLVYP